MDAVLKGIVKGISTKTKMDPETGAVEHVTSVKLVFRDLDIETLDVLAMAEASLRLASLGLAD